MKKFLIYSLSILTSIVLTGCGGGSSSGASSTTGILIDDVVAGVKYVNITATGYTDENGSFPYSSGLVEFYVGSIKIGELSSMTSDNKVFIQDIVGVERTNTTDSRVLKIATLLQSLDSDSSTDAIEIEKSDLDKFDGVTNLLDDLDLTTLLTEKGFTVKSEEEVKSHMENILAKYGELTDAEAPSLITSSILNGATNVSSTTAISLTFSEDIPKEYLTNEYFTLTRNQDSSKVELAIGNGGTSSFFGNEGTPISIDQASYSDFDWVTTGNNVIVLVPISELVYSESYTLTISSEIKDYAGNLLSNEGGNTDILIEFTIEDTSDTTAPVITSSATVSVDENQTSALTLTATDEHTITYSISGTDAESFNIDSSTGVITFKEAPDYETKSSYTITAIATDDSTNSSRQNINININDLYDPPMISHNGFSYGILTSPYTGRLWLDRNLGASQVCSSSASNFSSFIEYETSQGLCFGDYYQWGRGTDGHEKKDSLTLDSKITDLNVTDDLFRDYVYDWTSADEDGTIRKENWSKIDGSSVCPIGFRVPTLLELIEETINSGVTNETTAFTNFLKLPSAGARITGWGGTRTSYARIWSTNDNGSPTGYNSYLYINDSRAYVRTDYYRANGLSVRCIKESE